MVTSRKAKPQTSKSVTRQHGEEKKLRAMSDISNLSEGWVVRPLGFFCAVPRCGRKPIVSLCMHVSAYEGFPDLGLLGSPANMRDWVYIGPLFGSAMKGWWGFGKLAAVVGSG